jgi:predicted alpha/beta superfamily hydrolase
MVEFVARAAGLHPWDAVYLTGDHDLLGRWDPSAVRLDWQDSVYRTRLDLPPGTRVRYLFTRGSWRTAELDVNAQEHFPRELIAEPGRRVEVEIFGWGRNSVRYHQEVASHFLPHPHSLIVHLPPGYDAQTDRCYPVLLLQDGQNLFDANTAFAGVPWRCDETAERLVRNGEIRPLIQVGVTNTPDRLREYGPKPNDPDDLSEGYARFLIGEVLPLLAREYRILPNATHTGIGGSSMGGLIALHLARHHPEVFGRCAALSPSLWWDGERLIREVGDHLGGLARCRLWLDMGGQEGHSESGMAAMVRRARRLAFHFRKLPVDQFRFCEVPDAGHNETAWAQRYPDVLRFLYPAHE